MPYRGYTTEQKIEIIHAFDQRTMNMADFCRHWDINEKTLRGWIDRYERQGAEALIKATQWKRYSPELKREAVETFLTGKISRRDILQTYDISSSSVLQKWIVRYHEGTLSKKRGGSPMTHARSTTWQERITIVQDCLLNRTITIVSLSIIKSLTTKCISGSENTNRAAGRLWRTDVAIRGHLKR